MSAITPVFGQDNPAHGTIKPAVLVLGGASEIGRGVLRSLLDADWSVVAVSDEPVSPCEPGKPTSCHLRTLAGSVDNEHEGVLLARAVSQLKRAPTAIVALLGGEFQPGRVLDHPFDRLGDRLDQDLRPHLVAARHLLPILAATGRPATYLIVGGPAAESPWAGYGYLSVSAAALRSLAHVLNNEMQDTLVRVRQLSVCSPIRTESNREHACPDWPNAYELGHRVSELLAAPPMQPIAYLERRRSGATRSLLPSSIRD
jgi:NAD(P)-dependent dehydrogenase (short-subunit alcohol dehydrogenase family)